MKTRPSIHSLLAFQAEHSRYVCNKCDMCLPYGATLYGDHAYNYDLCQSCFDEEANEMQMTIMIIIDSNCPQAPKKMFNLLGFTRAYQGLTLIRLTKQQNDPNPRNRQINSTKITKEDMILPLKALQHIRRSDFGSSHFGGSYFVARHLSSD